MSDVAARLACVALTGCSSVLGIDSDRHLVVDGGGSSGADWACLSAPAPTPPASATIYFVVSDPATSANMNGKSGAPIPGIVLSACTRLDATCSTPLGVSAPTDASGRTTMVVPGGFDGYFQTPASGMFDAGIFAHEPIEGTQVIQQALVRSSLLALAAKITGVQLDPSAGTVLPYVLDCNSLGAAGVTFDVGALGPSEHVFYLSQAIPSTTATETDSTGSGFVLNVPPGSVTVSATNAAGQVVASNTTFVRASTTTFIQLRPSQATYSTGP